MLNRAERESDAQRNGDSDLHAAAGRKNLRGSLDPPRNWPLVHEMFAAGDGGTGDATSMLRVSSRRRPHVRRGFTANKPDPE
jgi:hypothetical protein